MSINTCSNINVDINSSIGTSVSICMYLGIYSASNMNMIISIRRNTSIHSITTLRVLCRRMSIRIHIKITISPSLGT